jgi:hypothetical protein
MPYLTILTHVINRESLKEFPDNHMRALFNVDILYNL